MVTLNLTLVEIEACEHILGCPRYHPDRAAIGAVFACIYIHLNYIFVYIELNVGNWAALTIERNTRAVILHSNYLFSFLTERQQQLGHVKVILNLSCHPFPLLYHGRIGIFLMFFLYFRTKTN